MPAHQDLNQCIQACEQTAQKLRGLANQASDTMVKSKLAEAAHHLDLCVEECKFSSQRVQQGAAAGMMA